MLVAKTPLAEEQLALHPGGGAGGLGAPRVCVDPKTPDNVGALGLSPMPQPPAGVVDPSAAQHEADWYRIEALAKLGDLLQREIEVVQDALIGGIKADGKIGDIKLYNAHVAFIVEGARRATGGYRFCTFFLQKMQNKKTHIQTYKTKMESSHKFIRASEAPMTEAAPRRGCGSR